VGIEPLERELFAFGSVRKSERAASDRFRIVRDDRPRGPLSDADSAWAPGVGCPVAPDVFGKYRNEKGAFADRSIRLDRNLDAIAAPSVDRLDGFDLAAKAGAGESISPSPRDMSLRNSYVNSMSLAVIDVPS